MMDENIFMKEKKPISFEDYLEYDENSRGNLGGELPVIVYRLLEYSIKDELAVRYGREEQVEIFRNAGRKAGEFFARKMLNLNQPLDQFVGELQKKMAEMKKSREDYDAQLKKIMTKEQYDSYVKKQAEREKQMKEGRQNRQKRQG